MPSEAAETEAILDAWAEHDAARAVLPADRDLIDATRALRAALLEAVLDARTGRDLFQASADLGRYLAEHGASPTLASSTLDGARAALQDAEGPWAAMRAALAEGYSRGQAEGARRRAAAAWDYPHCAVRLDATTVAIAAGYPEDDGEALAAWSDRVAHGVSMAGVRRVVVSGAAAPSAALRAAMETAGVEVLRELPEAPLAESRPRFRLWPPWGREGSRPDRGKS